MTELEKCMAGEWYDCHDKALFHSGCEGKLGSALELLQGKSDLI